MIMECNFEYCIYNKKFICILEEIQINFLGICEACEIVTVPDEYLEKYKNKRLKALKKIWTNYDK